ncbi:hypothetical protein [Acidianus infernus]|uniref:hypothetical protein n=1 Tax=Acidianus infernus TaxID=12915 RepID=UPI00197AD2A9|nr:hypothetical protein [Acidianus infernus]
MAQSIGRVRTFIHLVPYCWLLILELWRSIINVLGYPSPFRPPNPHLCKRRLSPRKVVERVDLIIAIMPSTRLREIASIINDNKLRLIVEIALDLH